MRTSKLLWVLFLSVLVCSQLWAYNNGSGSFRQVYYAGTAHTLGYYYDDGAPRVGHWQGTISSSDWIGPWAGYGDPTTSIGFPSSSWDYQYKYNEYGEGMVVYGTTLLDFAIAFNGSGDPRVMCTRYNLQGGSFIDCKDLVPLGTSHSQSDHGGYGIAAAERFGTVYAFTSTFTLVSDDVGHTFTQLLPVVDGLSDYEPMDAVTFYPAEGAPQIFIALSKRSSKTAAFVIWDVSTPLPLPSGAIRTLPGNGTDVYFQCGATMLGTAATTSTFSRCSLSAGSKNPCVQMILIGSPNGPNGVDNYVKRFEYDTVTDTVAGKGSCDEASDNLGYRAWPWFTTETGTSSDGSKLTVQQQRFVVNFRKQKESSREGFAIPSDFLVPKNHDSGNYGWQGTPTNTAGGDPDDTAEDLATWKNYWSLIGVVLGPPPFRLNGLDPVNQISQVQSLSNVFYGIDDSTQIKQSSSWANSILFSSGTEGKVGLGEEDNMTGGKFGFDMTYKQGWESKNSTTTTSSKNIDMTVGTQIEENPDWGTHGYAFFSVPVLLTQDTMVYAYDYVLNPNPDPNHPELDGTLLGQDLITTVAATTGTVPPVGIKMVKFELENPVADPDDPAMFLTFRQPFHNSTDLDAWHNDVCWEKTTMPDWTVILGTTTHGGDFVDQLEVGAETVQFVTSAKNTDTSGQTGAIELKESATLFSRLHLKGFNETLTAGQNSEWSTFTTTESDYGQNLKIAMDLAISGCPGNNPDWVKEITIQPYLLKATNTYNAPWIPVNYSQTTPWCITWYVLYALMCDGRTIGQSPAAAELQGQIGGGGSGAEGGAEALALKLSRFSLKGGHMSWKKSDGSLRPIPMTADTFDPALGATLTLNSHVVEAKSSFGKWTKEGQVWKFKTKDSAKSDRITLKLDFGGGTWSLEGEKLPLTEHFREFDDHVKVVLKVNEMYSFRFDADAAVKGDWEVSLPRTNEQKLEVTKYSGTFGWSDHEDKVVLEGKLPKTLDRFGDMSFVFNGHQRDIPLLGLEDFQKAFTKGKVLEYKEGGTHVVVDFGKKKWSAQFKRDQFDRTMAPRSGGAKVSVKVGGSAWYEREIQDFKSAMKLSFKS